MELCNLETCANDHFLNEMNSNGSYPLSFFGKSFNVFDKRLRIHTSDLVFLPSIMQERSQVGYHFVIYPFNNYIQRSKL